MIEDSFIALYARDFTNFAVKTELGQDVTTPLDRRMVDVRAHAKVMDARKGAGHLEALVTRLRDEALRFDGRSMLKGVDPVQASERHRLFLKSVADRLAAPDPLSTGHLVTDIPNRRRR